jgi:transcriptional regulator of acetoin/glycerol metabolism
VHQGADAGPGLARVGAGRGLGPAATPRDSTTTSGPDPRGDQAARIQAALDRCNGNQTRAARLLGIVRSTLIRQVDGLGMPRPRR